MENPNLPEELLIEIFSRLPAKSVGRCRCLSKSWRRNLCTSQFVKLHLNHCTKTDQKDAILMTRSGSIHTIRIPIDGTDRVVSRELDLAAAFSYPLASCNGLVLMVGDKEELYVVNPVTLQQVSVEYTPLSLKKAQERMEYSYGFGYDKIQLVEYSYAFGFDNSCDDYKIVNFSHCFKLSEPSVTFTDVYSLKNRVWKSANSSPYKHDIDYGRDHGAFLNGSVHWLTLDKDDRYMIGAFDLATELFREIPIPNDKLNRSPTYSVVVIEGCLSMLELYCIDTLEMWIMKEYGQVNSWTKFSVSTANDDWERCFVHPVCSIRENELVFITLRGTLLMWNLTEGTTRQITDDGAVRNNNGGIMFVASLVSPGQPDIAS